LPARNRDDRSLSQFRISSRLTVTGMLNRILRGPTGFAPTLPGLSGISEISTTGRWSHASKGNYCPRVIACTSRKPIIAGADVSPGAMR
jgi:hypothetical protein